MTTVKLFVAVADAESVTCAVNVNDPVAFGTPVIAPVVALKPTPPGSDPLAIDQE